MLSRAAGALLAGLVLASAIASPAAAAEPTTAQLAEALRAFGAGTFAPGDLRAIACEANAQEPTEFNCRWEQRAGGDWTAYSTWLAVQGSGWVLIDDPLPEPKGRNRMLEEERQRVSG